MEMKVAELVLVPISILPHITSRALQVYVYTAAHGHREPNEVADFIKCSEDEASDSVAELKEIGLYPENPTTLKLSKAPPVEPNGQVEEPVPETNLLGQAKSKFSKLARLGK
jgi:hypothetical protein